MILLSRFLFTYVYCYFFRKGDVLATIKEMLGKRLVTKQTAASGVLVKKVMVSEATPFKHESYLAILMDRESNGPVIVASPAGGMDIEEVAAKNPELMLKIPISIASGITNDECLKVANFLGLTKELIPTAAEQVKRLYELFIQVDATQIEINPLGETKDGRGLICMFVMY